MNSPEQPEGECPVDRLTRLTRESPDTPLPEDLCHHLENCQACRARLEANAAPAIDWKLVREALKEPPFSPGEARQGDPVGFSLLRLLTPSDDPSIVGRIGPFEITQVIGSGGMGLVLKARDPALDRFVAVKILAPHLAASATARKRFAREAKAAAAVIHDNVIGIYQVSEHHELPYLVMPYLPDPSLQQRLDTEGKLDVETALTIALQVAKGLEAAHSQGLIHRDVKPANVLLVNATSRAIITDFGLARAADDASLTNSGVLAGTPHYMSPEQARAESVDARTDLFSLGSLLFAMTSGHPPVNRELGSETIRAIASETMPRLSDAAPGVPFWLDRLVAWLHQSDPADRPQSARELAQILEQCLQHLRDPASHPLPDFLTTQEGNSMPTEKDKRLFAVAALGMFVITLLAPVQIAMLAPHVEHLPLIFACISFFLTLCFALLSWTEYISRFVVKAAVSLALVTVLVSGAFLGIRFLVAETGSGKPGQQQIDLQILRNEIAQLRAQQQEKQSNSPGPGGDAGGGGEGSMMMGGGAPGMMGTMGGMPGAGGPVAPMGGAAPGVMGTMGGMPGVNIPSVPGNVGPGGLGGPLPMGAPPQDFRSGSTGTVVPPVLPSPMAPPTMPPPQGTVLPPTTSGTPGSVPPLAPGVPSPLPPSSEAIPALAGGGGIRAPILPNTETKEKLPPPPDLNVPEALPAGGAALSLNPPGGMPPSLPGENSQKENGSKKPPVAGTKVFFRVNSKVPYVQVKRMVDLLNSLGLGSSLEVKASDAPGNVLDLLISDGMTKEEAREIRKRLESEALAFPALTVHFVQKGKALVEPLKSNPNKTNNQDILLWTDPDPKEKPIEPATPDKGKPETKTEKGADKAVESSKQDKGKPDPETKPEKAPAKGPAKETKPPTDKIPDKDKPANPPEDILGIA